MRCTVNCVSGTIMMPALPGKSFGYLILCPACKGTGSSKFSCDSVARERLGQLHLARREA